jgi:hypothetical protein
MPITTGDIRRDCYDCINRGPNIVAVAGNATKYDPYDQVTHVIGAPLVLPTGNTRIRQISFNGVAGGHSYYLPFQIDGITSVSLPTVPTFTEPRYFFTIRLTACAIFLDAYQPAPGTYTTPLGADDQRPRIIISHGNAATPYAAGMVGVNVAQNPAMFPAGARTQLNNDRNAMLAMYPGVKVGLAALYKNNYNQAVDVEVQRLIGQGHANVAYGSTTSVFGFYGPGGWEFYFQTWGGFDYTRQRLVLGPQQVLGATNLNEHRVIECRRFFP